MKTAGKVFTEILHLPMLAESMNSPQKAEGFPGQRIVVLPRNVVNQLLRDPLINRLIPAAIGYFPLAKGHFFERPDGISQAIFIFCLKGCGWSVLRGQQHKIQKGDLLVVPPDEPHSYGADEEKPWSIIWFHVAGDDVRLLLSAMGVRAENPVLQLGDDPQFPAVFEDVLDILEHGYASFQILHASKTLGYLISLMVWRARENWRTAPDLKQKITHCITYMKMHIDKPLRLAVLASMAGFTPSYFNVLFRQETGYSCIDFLTKLRIHQACQWLDNTDWPVKIIAARLGYNDPFYFSRIFHSITGLAPKEYRRSHKG